MKDFKLKFNLSSVAAGQRNTAVEPEMIAVSTTGTFRITAPVSRALGIAHGEYVQFISNRVAIDQAIAEQNEALVEFCTENGLDITTEVAAKAIHAEFDEWGITKGIQEFDKAGLPIMVRERIGLETRRKYVDANFDQMIEMINNSENEELKAAINREGISENEIKDILTKQVQGDEVPKFKGSKAANTSALTGVGVALTFSDSNVWNLLKEDLGEDANKMNKIYSVNITELEEAVVFDGIKQVTVKVAMLGDSRTVKSNRVGEKKADGSVIVEGDAEAED